MQALAEPFGRYGVVLVHLVDERLELGRLPGGGLVQGLRHPAVVGVGELVAGERVQDLHPVAVRPDGGGEVGGRVRGAAGGLAGGVQDAGGGGQRAQVERVEALLRHHRVEHQPGHVRRVGEGVALGDVGAVGDAVDAEPAVAEGLAQEVHVADGVRGAVEAGVRAEGGGAVGDGLLAGRGEVGGAHVLLQSGALQSALAGAALVEHDQAVVLEDGRELARDPLDQRHAGLAGAAGEEQQVALGGVGVPGHRHVELEGAGGGAAVVERHGDGPAGEFVRALAGRLPGDSAAVPGRFGRRRDGGGSQGGAGDHRDGAQQGGEAAARARHVRPSGRAASVLTRSRESA